MNENLVPMQYVKGQYEFYLKFWGEIENQNWVERDLGIPGKDFWFPSKAKRKEFKSLIASVAEAHNVNVVFGEYEGEYVRLRTIAQMTLTLPNGRTCLLEHDFGYAYPPDGAEYMFLAGNYSCDCNLSSFLAEAGYEVEPMDCGNQIAIVDFKVLLIE